MATATKKSDISKSIERPLFVKFPLKPKSKEPAVRFKSKDAFDTEGIQNKGIRLDGMLVLDIDPRNLPDGITIEGAVNLIRDAAVPVEECPLVRTGSGGLHIYLRLPTDAPKLAAKLMRGVDIKTGIGAYVVAPGSIHPNGQTYEAANKVKLAEAPIAPQQLIRMIEKPSVESMESPPGILEPDRLAIVLDGLAVEDYAANETWEPLMMACRHACPDGLVEFVDWCIGDPPYSGHAELIATRWNSVDPFVPGGITFSTLYDELIKAKKARADDIAPLRSLAILDFAGLEAEDLELKEEASINKPKFELLSADDLLALNPPEWLLERSLPKGSLGVLYGPPKSAKTFLALDIALSLATNQGEIHGLQCKPGRVLYVLAEGGASMMRDRVWSWLNSKECTVGDSFALHPRAINLSNQNAVDELISNAGTDWDLVIFDTLARCMSGDENTVKDMNAAIKGCDRIREATGAAVLLVHHSGKDRSKGLRGSTALLGAVDAVLKMQPDNDGYRLSIDELRHGEPAEPRRLQLQSIGNSAVLIAADTAQDDFDPTTMILDLASSVSDSIARKDFHVLVAEDLDIATSTARKHVAGAIPLGEINAIKSANGSLVWREPDTSSTSPNAEVIRCVSDTSSTNH